MAKVFKLPPFRPAYRNLELLSQRLPDCLTEDDALLRHPRSSKPIGNAQWAIDACRLQGSSHVEPLKRRTTMKKDEGYFWIDPDLTQRLI